MSSKKKGGKGGIKRTNASQAQSTGKSPPPKGNRGIARVDKNKSHAEPAAVKSGVARSADKNKQSTTEKTSRGVKKHAGRNHQKPSTEPVKKTGLARKDRNEKAPQAAPKTVKRTNKMHQSSGVEEKQRSVTRSAKANMSGSALGLEKKNPVKKGATKDRNATSSAESTSKGVSRTGKANQGSEALGLNAKPKAPKKKTGASSAFSQSSHKPEKSTSRKVQSTAQQRSTKEAKPGRSKTGTGGAHKTSSNIFGGSSAKSSAPAAATKNTSHMQSSFTFG